MDYFAFGSTPAEEKGVDMLDKNYRLQAQRECAELLEQIRRQFGHEPPHTQLQVKANYHEKGTYYEVVLYYRFADAEAMLYINRVESDLSVKWDEVARKNLGLVSS